MDHRQTSKIQMLVPTSVRICYLTLGHAPPSSRVRSVEFALEDKCHALLSSIQANGVAWKVFIPRILHFCSSNPLKLHIPIPGSDVNGKIPNLPSDLSLVAVQMDAFANVSDYFTEDLLPDALHLLIVEDSKANTAGGGKHWTSRL